MRVTNRSLKETYYSTEAAGLPVAFIPKPGLSKKLAVIMVQYGAIDLAFTPPVAGQSLGTKPITSPAGVAHFLEHQLFKKPSGNIMEEFARFGGYYNAATGYTATSYFFTCADNFPENLGLLLRLVFEPYFTADDVSRERLIIEQELKMYLDMPEMRISRNLLENLYHTHPVRLEIGGTVESIRDITPDVLQQCYRTFYHPANMIAVFVGDLDQEKILRQVTQYLKNQPMEGKSENGKIARPPIEEPSAIKIPRADIRMSIDRPRILIGFKDRQVGLTGEKLIQQSILTDVMLECLFGKSSVLYNRWYNAGLIDESFNFSYELHPTYGLTILGGESDHPDELYDAVQAGIRQAKKARVKKRDVNRLKRKYLGRFARLFDTPEHLGMLFGYYHFNHLKVFDTVRYFKAVLAGNVQARLAECLDEAQHAVSIIRPGK